MKTAYLIFMDQYADWEGAYLASQLNQREDWQVKTASTSEVVTSIGGLKLQVDMGLDLIPATAALVVMIGGNAWQRAIPMLTTLIRQRLEQGLPVGAICGAVDYLARNGLLTNYRHTGNSQFLWQNDDQYVNPNEFEAQQVVVDHNLVTANGTGTLEFTSAILTLIDCNDDTAKQAILLQQLGYYEYCRQFGDPYSMKN